MRALNGFVAGFGTAYLFDPAHGRGRRRRFADRASRVVRQTGRYGTKKARYNAGRLRGLKARARSSVTTDARATADSKVVQRIRSDALRDIGLSTKDIDVSVEDGVATLRGSVSTSRLADDLIDRVRRVPGVEDVAAMIHVAPGEESADDEETPTPR